MGKQKMLINVHEDETRIALTEADRLVGLHFQQTSRERTAGNIYRGRIVKVNPAFQAAFVDYGEKRNGFLSISDLNLQLFKGPKGHAGRPKIQSLLRGGQDVMVQVIKEGMREKGAALTTNISLPGRYLVLAPYSERSGVSRKIEDSDKRSQLRDILDGLLGDDPAGVIIRTAGIDRPAADLKRDLAALRKTWKTTQDHYAKLAKPGQVYQEASSIVRVLRDYYTEDIEEVWVDTPESYQEALGYFKSTLPKYQKRLRLYVGDMTLFSAHNVEEQIEALGSSRVPLRSGGGIIIEPTEAMVSIDVNSGRSNQESDIEDTALRTNLEAAEEVARQLRLRNLGGLIVIDFIDMHAAKNRAKVAQALAAGLKGDKARTTVGTISQFGLLEMSRQRIDMELSMGLRTTCGVCNGTGSIPTVPASANNLLRKIRTLAAAGRYGELHADLPMDLSNYMLNSKREALRDLELEFEIQIHLFGDPDLSPGHVVELSGKAPRLAEGAEPVGEFVEEPAAVSQTGKELGMRGGRKRRRRRGRGGLEREEAASVESHDFSHDDEDREMLEIPPDSLDEDEDKDEDKEEAGAPAQWEEERSDESAATTYEQYAAAPEESARDRDNGRPLDDGDTRILFSSAHVVTRPDAPPQPPRMVRSSPFKAIAKTAKPGLLFDSEQRGGIVVEHFAVVAAAEPEARLEIARAAPEPARRPSASAQPLPAPLDGEKPPRRRHRRGRGGHAQVPAAAGEPGADEEAAPEEEAEQPEPVAAKPRARRAASPRKPRARGPRRPVDADADPNGNVKPRVEDFELPEVNGNIVARER